LLEWFGDDWLGDLDGLDLVNFALQLFSLLLLASEHHFDLPLVVLLTFLKQLLKVFHLRLVFTLHYSKLCNLVPQFNNLFIGNFNKFRRMQALYLSDLSLHKLLFQLRI
jgi:hypothetical protein